MYNGIGLPTPRGSGTNGYVQRNLSTINASQSHQKYKTEEEIKKEEAVAFRGPNPEILEHQRKRQIEVQCMELEDLMEEQGYGSEEIAEKVAVYRASLQKKDAEAAKLATSGEGNPKAMIFGTKLHELAVDSETGRPVMRNSHEMAAAKLMKNMQFKEALRLDKDYVAGSSLQRDKATAARKAEATMREEVQQLMQKETLILEDSSSDSENETKKLKKKQKKAAKVARSSPVEKGNSRERTKKRRKSPEAAANSPERSTRPHKGERRQESDRSAPLASRSESRRGQGESKRHRKSRSPSPASHQRRDRGGRKRSENSSSSPPHKQRSSDRVMTSGGKSRDEGRRSRYDDGAKKRRRSRSRSRG